jgi:hypothetical protein
LITNCFFLSFLCASFYRLLTTADALDGDSGSDTDDYADVDADGFAPALSLADVLSRQQFVLRLCANVRAGAAAGDLGLQVRTLRLPSNVTSYRVAYERAF